MTKENKLPILTKKEQDRLGYFQGLASQHEDLAIMIKTFRNNYLQTVLKEKGLDPKKNYQIDPETRVLTEVEKEKKEIKKEEKAK